MQDRGPVPSPFSGPLSSVTGCSTALWRDDRATTQLDVAMPPMAEDELVPAYSVQEPYVRPIPAPVGLPERCMRHARKLPRTYALRQRAEPNLHWTGKPPHFPSRPHRPRAGMATTAALPDQTTSLWPRLRTPNAQRKQCVWQCAGLRVQSRQPQVLRDRIL